MEYLAFILCVVTITGKTSAVHPVNEEGVQTLQLDLIKYYFELGYKYKEILASLICIHGIKISYRHLKRLIQKLNLYRKVPESHIDLIIGAILKELSGSGRCIGYKSMWKRLRLCHGLHVHRSTVLRLLWIADPEGMERRKAKRLLRRKYKCPGPDFVWHVDGYDKIKRFGFAIHGAVDGFSRKILWLEVGQSNNDPKIISRHYLQTVKRHGCKIPTIVRSDLGTENTTIRQLQIYFRYNHNDAHSAERSFILGKSTSNQRIESMWSFLRRQCLDFWITFFKDLQETNVFNDGDIFHRQCLIYCFTPVIRSELIKFVNEWNVHDISGCRSDGPKGKPDIMYTLPQLYNTESHSHVVSEDEVNVCIQMYSKSENPGGCLPEFYRLFQLLVPVLPTSAEEAFDVYIDLLGRLPELLS